jgi:hypothetical protein
VCSPRAFCRSSEFSASFIGLAEVGGQALDTELLQLGGGEVVEVALHRLGQLVALLDAFQPRVKESGEAQVDVGRRIRTPELHPGGLLLPGWKPGTLTRAERFLRLQAM